MVFGDVSFGYFADFAAIVQSNTARDDDDAIAAAIKEAMAGGEDTPDAATKE